MERIEYYKVVGECDSPEKTLEQLRKLRPQLLILDVMLGGMLAELARPIRCRLS